MTDTADSFAEWAQKWLDALDRMNLPTPSTEDDPTESETTE